jgi:hypothetical protein
MSSATSTSKSNTRLVYELITAGDAQRNVPLVTPSLKWTMNEDAEIKKNKVKDIIDAEMKIACLVSKKDEYKRRIEIKIKEIIEACPKSLFNDLILSHEESEKVENEIKRLTDLISSLNDNLTSPIINHLSQSQSPTPLQRLKAKALEVGKDALIKLKEKGKDLASKGKRALCKLEAKGKDLLNKGKEAAGKIDKDTLTNDDDVLNNLEFKHHVLPPLPLFRRLSRLPPTPMVPIEPLSQTQSSTPLNRVWPHVPMSLLPTRWIQIEPLSQRKSSTPLKYVSSLPPIPFILIEPLSQTQSSTSLKRVWSPPPTPPIHPENLSSSAPLQSVLPPTLQIIEPLYKSPSSTSPLHPVLLPTPTLPIDSPYQSALTQHHNSSATLGAVIVGGSDQTTKNDSGIVSSEQFRAMSQRVSVSPNVKIGRDRTYDDQAACHKTPNVILADAFNKTSHQPNTQAAILRFAHSDQNIIYSSHNDDHSRRERALKSEVYKSQDVKDQAAVLTTSLKCLHVDDPFATARVISATANRGVGYTEAVASLDKRTFNSPAEKRAIDKARNDVTTGYSSSESFSSCSSSSNSPSRIPVSASSYVNSYGTHVHIPAHTRSSPCSSGKGGGGGGRRR